MFAWTGASPSNEAEKFKDDSSIFEDIEAELEAEQQARAVVKDHDHTLTTRHRKGHSLHAHVSVEASIEHELNLLLEEQYRPDGQFDMASVSPSTTSYYSYGGSETDTFSASRYKNRTKRQRRKQQAASNSPLSEYQVYLRESNPAGVIRKWYLQLRHLSPQRRAVFLGLGATMFVCACLVVVASASRQRSHQDTLSTTRPRKLQLATRNVVVSETVPPKPVLGASAQQWSNESLNGDRALVTGSNSLKEQYQPHTIPDSHQQQQQQQQQQLSDGAPKGHQYTRGQHEDYLPHHLRDSFADVWDLPIRHADRPFYFHIPKSGGTALADILTHCLRLISASKIGSTEGHGLEPMLEVNTYVDKGKYVNVDTASPQGLQRARDLGLVPSGLADVIITHRFHEGAALFDSTHRARAFAIFRHPVRRAISMMYYLQRATWEPTYDPTLANLTLEEYAVSSRAEENWVTRFLTHEYQDRLTDQHVELAKEIIRRKMIVGLLDRFDESIKRIQLYFGWWETIVKKDPERCIRCQQRKTQASNNKMSHPNPPETDPGYQALARLNWADLEVYEYTVELFEEQASLVSTKEASLV